jgi:hypothetical protein
MGQSGVLCQWLSCIGVIGADDDRITDMALAYCREMVRLGIQQ